MTEPGPGYDLQMRDFATRVDPQAALEGTATISIETGDDRPEEDTLTYIEDHFGEFLRNLRYLSQADQELLLSYYILARSQETLALWMHTSQTIVSSRIRLAMQALGTFLILSGPPTPEVLTEVMAEIGMESTLDKPLSELVVLYARCRSFERVAQVTGLHRPTMRRALTLASKTLVASTDMRQRAIGAWLFGMIDKASVRGIGKNTIAAAKEGSMYITNTRLLGEFRIKIEDPEFDSVFTSRAQR